MVEWALIFTYASNAMSYSQSVVSVLQSIVKAEPEELRLLEAMHKDIQSLKQGYFNAGNIHLDEAAHLTDKDKQIEAIKKAKDEFIRALGIEREDPFRRALIEYRIGICGNLLGDIKPLCTESAEI